MTMFHHHQRSSRETHLGIRTLRDYPVVEAIDLRKAFAASRGRFAAISRSRGVVHAVNGVDFVAEPGQIFGLLGPNGAGKTTTLRMLATTVTPTGGTATVAGHDIQRDPLGVRRNIGVLTTNIGLYGRLTARENVAYFARLHGMDGRAAARRIDELFRLLEIEDYADRRADHFSTGMKQKVAIARAVVHDPPVMIFDEPTTGLDVMSSRTVVDFIRAMRDAGKCVILSTHAMHDVEKLCYTVLIIYKGSVLTTGTPAELVRRTGQNDLEEAFLHLVGAGFLAQEVAHA
jgi:sodium transport system ATP-binding protein